MQRTSHHVLAPSNACSPSAGAYVPGVRPRVEDPTRSSHTPSGPQPTATAKTTPLSRSRHWAVRIPLVAAIVFAATGCSAEHTEKPSISFAASAQQLTATWTNNATHADGIYVDRCAGSDCAGFSRLTSLPPTATTYTDTGVQPSNTYCYRVGAFNGAGIGWSDKACGSVPEAPVDPTPTPDAAGQPPAADAGLPPHASDFPIDMTGATPQTRRTTLVANIPAQPQQAILTLERVVDPDFADEGTLTVNGHSPVALFGDETAGDGETVDIAFATPVSWWQDGTNELVFTHDRTQGYLIGGASVSFSRAPDDVGPPVVPRSDATLAPPPAPDPDAAVLPPEPDATVVAPDASVPSPAEARGDVSCQIVSDDAGNARVNCDVSNLQTGCAVPPRRRSDSGVFWAALLLLGLCLRRTRRVVNAAG